MMTIALTGATGFLGRHLLFEFAKQYFFQLDNLQILIFGRQHKNFSLSDRIKEIFDTEFNDYLGNFSAENQIKIDFFLEKNIQYIDIQLDNLFPISQSDFEKIKNLPIEHFFHLAAMPDLRNSAEAEKDTFQTNVTGTQNLLNLINSLTIKEFDYVGTAYVCGKNKGLLPPNFGNLQGEFHNPYEKSKLQAEMLVQAFAEKKGLAYKIFRPSVISGRLLEKPLGQTNRFNVFYEIFAFLFSEKLLKTKSLQKALTEQIDLPLRAVFDLKSGINIVSVDYVAKLMFHLCMKNAKGTHFYLVNEQNVLFVNFLKGAMKALKISGIEAVEKMPQDASQLEKMYDQRIGIIFNTYLSAEPVFFDTKNVQQTLWKANLCCPIMDEENAFLLINYAMQKNFGRTVPKILEKL